MRIYRCRDLGREVLMVYSFMVRGRYWCFGVVRWKLRGFLVQGFGRDLLRVYRVFRDVLDLRWFWQGFVDGFVGGGEEWFLGVI